MSAETEGRKAAERFRSAHHLGAQPLGDLVALVEQATGIDVAVLDVGPDEHGLTMRDPESETVFIGIARTANPMRQRSTLAHELAHVLFADWRDGETRAWSSRDRLEIRADAFARHLLVPIDGLRSFLTDKDTSTEAMLSAVVQYFLVSPAIAAIALHDAGSIDAATKATWRGLSAPRLAVRFGWSDQYAALQADSDRRRAPQRLLTRAIAGYSQGLLPAQAIARLRGVGLDVVLHELEEAGIAAPDHPVVWTDPNDLPAVDVDLAALDDALDEPHTPPAPSEAARESG